MAGGLPWIPAYAGLGDHPKLWRMVGALSIEDAQAVGHLLYLWWWATDYAPDGDVSAFSPLEIARAARWRGHADTFVDALRISGFLDDQTHLNDWDEYAGSVLAQRARDAERKRIARAEDVRTTSAGRPRMSTVDKKREEKKRTHLSRGSSRAENGHPKDPDPIWDGLSEWLHRQPETRSERGAWNKAAKELREIGVCEPSDVVAHGLAYQRKYPNITPTPNGLVKHWSELNGSGPQPVHRSRTATEILETWEDTRG